MPNRILKESICSSESIDSLTEFQEVFFYRLLVNCDDFGRFDARVKMLSSRLFPLRPIAPALIQNAIDALVREGMITLYSVSGKPYLQVNAWREHQQPRANKSKYPAPEECTSDSSCNQMISDEIKCNQIPEDVTDNRYSIFDTRKSVSVSDSDTYAVADDEAHSTIMEQNRVLEAAENAGFKCSPTLNSMIVALYADNGLEKMLDAINECVTHGAVNIAYLKAVLNGTGKRRSQKAKVPAQDFEQRDYSDVPEEMAKSLDEEVSEFLKLKEG